MLFQPDRNGHPFNGESSSGRQLSTAGRIFMAAAAGMQHSPAGAGNVKPGTPPTGNDRE
jgi:hypothetical protein